MTQPLKSHGLDGSLVEPDWPALCLDEIRRVLADFPAAGVPQALISASPRPFSAASLVQTDRRQVFVKRHARALRDQAGLFEEHRFMQHLLAHGIEVPRVLATSRGGTAFETPEWTYEVHEIPPGIDMYEDAVSWTPFRSAGHARSAGALLARLHVAAERFGAPPRPARPLLASFSIFSSSQPVQALEKYLSLRPALTGHPSTARDIQAAFDELSSFHSELAPWLTEIPTLWTHNDLHASNVFWSDRSPGATVTSVIDFGLADRTNTVHDLAQAIERSMIEWLRLMNHPEAGEQVAVHLDDLWALLDGYEQIRKLSVAESAALAPMLALCHAEFALSEADYFLAVLNSEAKARIATDHYLLGHARWFYGPGRWKLLDPVRRWAESRRRTLSA